MKLFDLHVPFFVPLWRRVATVGACAVWVVVELVAGSPGWAAFVGALGLYAAWHFFWTWPGDLGDGGAP